MKNAANETELSEAMERALDFIKSGKNWADYAHEKGIASFGADREAQRRRPIQSSRTIDALVARGLVKVEADRYVAVKS